MSISNLLKTLALFFGSQFILSAFGIYNPGLWFLTGWILCYIDIALERGNLRW